MRLAAAAGPRGTGSPCRFLLPGLVAKKVSVGGHGGHYFEIGSGEKACLQPVRKSCYLSQSRFSDPLANLGYNFLSALGQSGGIKRGTLGHTQRRFPSALSNACAPRRRMQHLAAHYVKKKDRNRHSRSYLNICGFIIAIYQPAH